MEALWQLLYRSEQAYEMDSADMLKLLFDARTFNRDHGISGLLLHQGGRFMQLLEGERDQIKALYARIAADPRHRDPVMEIDAPAPGRLFPDWHMGYAEAPLVGGLPILDSSESVRDASDSLRALASDRPCVRRMLAFIEGRADD